MNQGYNAYKSALVDVADKGKLIVICYDVAIKHANLALGVQEGYSHIEERMRHIYKMQDAINELLNSLNFDAGEIAINLCHLYEYMLRRLAHAIVKVESEPIREVLTYLDDMRDAWKTAIQTVRDERFNSNSPVPQVASTNFALNG